MTNNLTLHKEQTLNDYLTRIEQLIEMTDGLNLLSSERHEYKIRLRQIRTKILLTVRDDMISLINNNEVVRGIM